VTAQSLHLLLPPISAAAPGTLYEQLVMSLKRAISEGQLAHARELLQQARREAAEAGLKPAEIRRLFLENLTPESQP
jgi:hypothetical protein